MESYEPASRYYHAYFSSKHRPYVWGGRTVDYETSSEDDLIKLGSCIEQFDPCYEVWRQLNTAGTPHPGLDSVACAVSVNGNVYMYGGGSRKGYEGVLSKLNMKTLTWSQLMISPETRHGPMKKIGCGFIFIQNKLVLIGGYGIPTGRIVQPRTTFIRDTDFSDGRGWSNEIHVFKLTQGLWSSPTVRGVRPPPCSYFTVTSIDNHRAIMFGGYQPRRGSINDLYIIDFNTMEFTKLKPSRGESWPVERSGHAACCIGYAGDHIHLLISGGLGRDGKPLSDMWLFDLVSKKWKEITLPDGTFRRWAHSVTAIAVCPGLEDVTMFGGSPDEFDYDKPEEDDHRIAETTIITLERLGSEWIPVGVANNSQRGSSERVRDKMILKSGTATQGSPFDLERRVTSYFLCKVEREGVQLRSGISSKNRDFQALLRLKTPDANLALIKWLNANNKSDIKPSWRNLLLVLCLVKLEILAQQLEEHVGWTYTKDLSKDTSIRVQDPGRPGEEVSLDSVFTMASLTQLEVVAKIPVLTELKAKSREFQAVIRVKQPNISRAINKWLTTSVLSRIKPTWKSLLLVLRLIHLDSIADQILVYLKPSLSSILEKEGEDLPLDYCVVM